MSSSRRHRHRRRSGAHVTPASRWNLADGPDEIVKAVRTNFKHGADHIKMPPRREVVRVPVDDEGREILAG
jgi:hypothetical protein